jgi:ABC-type uncharacterized transport system ATPase subunit
MPGAANVLETNGLTMDFRGFRALDGVDLRIAEANGIMVVGEATTAITNENCNKYTFHYAYDLIECG